MKHQLSDGKILNIGVGDTFQKSLDGLNVTTIVYMDCVDSWLCCRGPFHDKVFVTAEEFNGNYIFKGNLLMR